MRVALLGTGLMGAAMARRLAACGHEVTVYNRTPARAADLAEAGCRVADDPAAAVAAGDVIILTLADAEAIEAVLFGAVPAPVLDGRTVIQMGTIGGSQSTALAARLADAGAAYLEAPVLGSVPEAAAGTLLVMAAGPEATFEGCLPVLRDLGRDPVRFGEPGQAATVKLALNQLIASLTTAFALSLGLVRREGIDVEAFMGLLRQSALYAPTFDKKLPRMLGHDYGRPNFPTRHLVKDIRLFREQAAALGLDPAMLDGVEEVVLRAIEQGLGEADYSALYEGVVTGGSRPGPDHEPPPGKR